MSDIKAYLDTLFNRQSFYIESSRNNCHSIADKPINVALPQTNW